MHNCNYLLLLQIPLVPLAALSGVAGNVVDRATKCLEILVASAPIAIAEYVLLQLACKERCCYVKSNITAMLRAGCMQCQQMSLRTHLCLLGK